MFHVPAVPHDSWVVGDRPYVSLHFMGADQYCEALRRRLRRPGSRSAASPASRRRGSRSLTARRHRPVSEMPSGPGVIPEPLIAEIAAERSSRHRHVPADLPAIRRRHRRAAAADAREHDPDLRRPRAGRPRRAERGAARRLARAGDPRRRRGRGRPRGGGGAVRRTRSCSIPATRSWRSRSWAAPGGATTGRSAGGSRSGSGARLPGRRPQRRTTSREAIGDGAAVRARRLQRRRSDGRLDAARLEAFFAAVKRTPAVC